MYSSVQSRGFRLLLLIAAVLIALTDVGVPAAHAQPGQATRVVAPNGDDGNPGTEQRPWRTLGHGLRQVQPGQTLLVRAGTYTENLTSVIYDSRRTSPSARIRVAGWPGERPVVIGQWHIRSASWWTFEGFDIRWPPNGNPKEPLVKLMGGRGWVFASNRVSGAHADAGVYVGVSTESGLPRDWAVTGNCIYDTRATDSTTERNHNIYVQSGVGSGPGLVERNLLFRAPNGTNLKLGSGATSTSPTAGNVTVRYNTMFDAGQNLLVEHDVHDVVIERNIFGKVTSKPSEYGNLRGHGVRGSTVVARDNVAWWAARFIFNTLPLSTRPAPSGIVDGGGNRFGSDPRYSAISGCSGFAPTAGHALAYGHRARVERVSGSTRMGTSVALSSEVHARGSSRVALIARADAYPDALAGAPLAQKLGAPLLLTLRDRLDSAVAAEIDRLGVREVVVLGGEAAVSNRVLQELRARPSVQQVRRLSGSDRFETARRIAAEVGGRDVYVVEGASSNPARGWPDAVSVSALAARQQRPILLVTRDVVPPGTAAALTELRARSATIVGGTGAVSSAVQRQIASAVGGSGNVERVSGNTRYSTSVEVARRAIADGAEPASTWIATGQDWPDALAAGPAAAATNGILILAPGREPAAVTGTVSFLRDVLPRGARPRIVGGGGAVTNPVEDRLAAAVPAS